MKLNYKRTLLVGFAFLSICAFWQLYDNVIPLILKNTFHMKDSLVGVVMAMDNVLALFLLPFFGKLSDKCHTKLGRRTPFILGGTAAAVILMNILPYADNHEKLLLFVIPLGLLLIAMGTYRSPAVALMPDVTPKPLRSKGNAVINLMGSAGGILILILGMVFATGAARNALMPYGTFFGIVSILMILSLGIFMLTVREPRFVQEMHQQSREYGIEEGGGEERRSGGRKLEADERRSLLFILLSIVLWFMGYNAVTSKYSVYADKVLSRDFNMTLIIAQAAAIVSYLPVGIIASKAGRKKTILAGVVMLTIAFGTASFLRAGSSPLLMNCMFALAGIAWATINVNSFPMVVEMCRGGDVGKYTGFYYTASMAAQTITPYLSGLLMDNTGLTALFPYATVFTALAFVTMLFVRHGDSKPEARRGLEALDND